MIQYPVVRRERLSGPISPSRHLTGQQIMYSIIPFRPLTLRMLPLTGSISGPLAKRTMRLYSLIPNPDFILIVFQHPGMTQTALPGTANTCGSAMVTAAAEMTIPFLLSVRRTEPLSIRSRLRGFRISKALPGTAKIYGRLTRCRHPFPESTRQRATLFIPRRFLSETPKESPTTVKTS